MFAPIYFCPVHGETWHAAVVEIIDSQNDEVYEIRACPQVGCTHECRPLFHDGKQVLHPLTDEEMYWETMNWGDDEDELQRSDYD